MNDRKKLSIGIVACTFLTLAIVLSVATPSYGTTANDGDYYCEKETSGICGDNIKWTYDRSSKLLTISGSGAMYDAGYEGLWPYNTSHLFKMFYKIDRIEFKGQITHIGDRVFAFTSAKTINLPATLESIGKEAFRSSELTSIELPSSLKEISKDSFLKCNQLKSIKFPADMETIPFTIEDCPSLKTVLLPDNLKKFDGFSGCVNYIPDFSNCNSLESVYIREIGNCKILIIPDTVNEVVIIGDVVTSIELGSNVSSFKSQSSSPNYISVGPSNPYLKVIDGVLYSKDMKTMVFYPSGKTDTTFTIPENVGTVEGMFNKNLKTLTITKNVTNCENINLKNLEILNIPSEYKSFIKLPSKIACVPIDFNTTSYIENGILLKYYSKYIDSVVATKLNDGSYKIHLEYNTEVPVKSIRVGSQYNECDIQTSESNDFILNSESSYYPKIYLSIDTGEGDETPPSEYDGEENKTGLMDIIAPFLVIFLILAAIIGGGGGVVYYIVVIR